MTTITSVRKWFLARPLFCNAEVKSRVRDWGIDAIRTYGEEPYLYGCFDTEQGARDACRGRDGVVVFYIDVPIPKEVNDYIKDRCEKILADREDTHDE